LPVFTVGLDAPDGLQEAAEVDCVRKRAEVSVEGHDGDADGRVRAVAEAVCSEQRASQAAVPVLVFGDGRCGERSQLEYAVDPGAGREDGQIPVPPRGRAFAACGTIRCGTWYGSPFPPVGVVARHALAGDERFVVFAGLNAAESNASEFRWGGRSVFPLHGVGPRRVKETFSLRAWRLEIPSGVTSAFESVRPPERRDPTSVYRMSLDIAVGTSASCASVHVSGFFGAVRACGQRFDGPVGFELPKIFKGAWGESS